MSKRSPEDRGYRSQLSTHTTMPVELPLQPSTLPMGANIVEDGSGATFRVWAPRADAIWVRGSFNEWKANDDSKLHRSGEDWVGFIPGVKAGDRFKFYVDGDLDDEDARWKRDPWARELTKAPAHPKSECIIHDPRSFHWHDAWYHPPYF